MHFVDEHLYIFRHLQIRVRRGEHKDVRSHFDALRFLRFDFPVGAKEYQQIQRDQRKGDDRPAAALHVFMAQRDQHRATPSDRKGREK